MGHGKTPAVSVCVPVNGHAGFLAPTVDSVLAQDYEDFELIICHSAGAGEQLKSLQETADRDKRVRLVEDTDALDRGRALNRCLAIASSPLIKPLLPGDELDPRAISLYVECMAAHPEVALVTASEKQITDDGAVVSIRVPLIDAQAPEDGVHSAKCSLIELTNHFGSSSGVMFKREFAADGFDGRFHIHADWNLWLKIALFGKVMATGKELCATRTYRLVPADNLSVESLVGLRDLLIIRDDYSDFVASQGIDKADWYRLVQTRIEETFALLLSERGLDASAARYALETKLAESGEKAAAEMCLSYCDLVYESMSRIASLKDEHDREVEVIGKDIVRELAQARQTIRNMEESVSWKITEPLRNFLMLWQSWTGRA